MGWSARVDKGAYGCIRVGGESFFTCVERLHSVLVQSLEWASSSKESYPDLFVCLAYKEALICDVISPPDWGNMSWNLQFHRAFHNW